MAVFVHKTPKNQKSCTLANLVRYITDEKKTSADAHNFQNSESPDENSAFLQDNVQRRGYFTSEEEDE